MDGRRGPFRRYVQMCTKQGCAPSFSGFMWLIKFELCSNKNPRPTHPVLLLQQLPILRSLSTLRQKKKEAQQKTE
jgi:hypothetical protein